MNNLPSRTADPINELLSTNDLAYSNIFFVEFRMSNINSIKVTDKREKSPQSDLFSTNYSTDNELAKKVSNNSESKNILSSYISRIESFTLPTQVNDTHNISFYNRDFTKISTSYKQQKTFSITVTLDDYMALMLKMSSAGGLNLASINDNVGKSMFNNPAKTMDVILKTGFLNANESDIENDSTSYTFKNAKFLGFENGLKFHKSSAEKLSLTLAFKYQEMVKTF